MRGARRDANHAEVREILREEGCEVEDTGDAGNGFPDLVVKTPRGTVILVEIKDGKKPPSARKLTDKEQKLAARWGSSYVVVEDELQARAVAKR